MAIFDTQHPWALAVGLLGNLISCMVVLAPVPTFHRIYKKKSTEGFQSLPYLVTLFSCMLWLYYAFIKTDAFLLITTNAFGSIVEAIYIALYVVYATKEARIMTIKLFTAMNVVLYAMIVLFAHFTLEWSTRVEVLGWINVALSVSVYAAPLSVIAQVVRTKSVEFMPCSLSLFLTLNAVTWFGYGVLKHEKCVAIPNIVGILLGVVQIAVYGIYKNSGNKIVEGKQGEEIKDCASLGAVENRDQVHQTHNVIINVQEDIKNTKKEENVRRCHEEVIASPYEPRPIEVV